MNLSECVISERHLSDIMGDFLKTGDGVQDSVLTVIRTDNIAIANEAEGSATALKFMRTIGRIIFDNKPKNIYVAKTGKFEHTLFVPYLDELTVITDFLERIIREVEGTAFMADDRMYPISLSVGCLFFRGCGVRLPESLFSAAAQCCKLASEQGKGRLVAKDFDEEYFALYHRHLSVAPEITKALEFDRFVLYLQRIDRIRPVRPDDASQKYEVLVRMVDEQGELIPPGEFIGVAEQYGMIRKVDEWVIRKSFEEYRKVFPEGDGELSINVSGYSIVSRDFLDFVEELFELHDIPPNRICFEITETFVISEFSVIEEFVQRFGSRGAKFAMDDFGAGFASFSYLHNVHFDYIKIDGGYVRSVLESAKSMAIVKSVSILCHDLDIQTVAEFVESGPIFDEMMRLGVDFVQGFHLHKPCPIEELYAANK